jgi:secondary thiamine-phosphate synthase enzyme
MKNTLKTKKPYATFHERFFCLILFYKKNSYMAIKTSTFHVKTSGATDIININPHVEKVVSESSLSDGFILLFIAGSTASITTIEYESGVVNDLKKAIERIAPHDILYEHDNRWGDGNGHSHVSAALLGPSLTIPLVNGRMLLGTWQQIVLCDFDNRPRMREVIVQGHAADE